MNRHLSHDELIDRIYGIAAEPVNAHLQDCAGCQSQFLVLEERRAVAAIAPEISGEKLAMQRRRIMARLDERPSSRLKWVPALAAGLLFAVALSYHPAPAPVTKASNPQANHADTLDDQLYSEIYALEAAEEPRAASPIRGLFEPIAFIEGN